MQETQLYEPVKKLFEDMGFVVQAEVHGMDVLAVKEETMVVIELKTSYNLKLVLQAVERQKMTGQVYVAIPRPTFKLRRSRAFQEKEHLLRRLEIGLILVAMDVKTPYAQIVFDPKPFSIERSQARGKNRKEKALKELAERHGDYNIGGTNGKLVTAYRERALKVVAVLMEYSEMAPKDIKIATQNDKAQSLLYDNHYGWFVRLRKGIYGLTPSGIAAFEEYQHIIQKIT
ncbi:MAG: hypothetical protein H7X94_14265 [Vallitaleaceae bacterium]|nr:hypothetical protein [Vallitaleaceae bacterium]